jgi:hypothetical protein
MFWESTSASCAGWTLCGETTDGELAMCCSQCSYERRYERLERTTHRCGAGVLLGAAIGRRGAVDNTNGATPWIPKCPAASASFQVPRPLDHLGVRQMALVARFERYEPPACRQVCISRFVPVCQRDQVPDPTPFDIQADQRTEDRPGRFSQLRIIHQRCSETVQNEATCPAGRNNQAGRVAHTGNGVERDPPAMPAPRG